MADKEFTERELGDFSDFNNFGELPEDLRGMGPITLPGGDFLPGMEGDVYGSVFGGGATRSFVEPIPGAFSNQFSFSAINYLPRANFESFRSQRFFQGGSAFLPPDPTTYVPLLVDMATLPPGSPQTGSTGTLTVPQGFAAVITGLRQWIGDAAAFHKPDGSPDDIAWRIEAGGVPIFNYGNFPLMISSLDTEGKLFAIANENTTLQLSVKNCIDPSRPDARSIAVKGALTGHWFPIDEIDDIFRNR